MAVLDPCRQSLLAGALAILIAIAISLKALFAIERRLFRMESHILKLSNKILGRRRPNRALIEAKCIGRSRNGLPVKSKAHNS
jgi:hypothetical protein